MYLCAKNPTLTDAQIEKIFHFFKELQLALSEKIGLSWKGTSRSL